MFGMGIEKALLLLAIYLVAGFVFGALCGAAWYCVKEHFARRR